MKNNSTNIIENDVSLSPFFPLGSDFLIYHSLTIAVAPNNDVYTNNYTNNTVAMWSSSTSTWSTLGSNFVGNCIAIVTMPNGDVYVGGNIPTYKNISKWNYSTSAWEALGTGFADGFCKAISVASNGDVYAGGAFTTAGGVSVNHIAKWSPSTSTWEALEASGAGLGLNASCNGIALASNGNVYAGGEFTTAGGVNAKFVALYSKNIRLSIDGKFTTHMELNDAILVNKLPNGEVYYQGSVTKI